MKFTSRLLVITGLTSLLLTPGTFAATARTLTGEYVSSFETGMQPLQAVFTPADGMAWQLAKTTFQVAESNYHGIVEHGSIKPLPPKVGVEELMQNTLIGTSAELIDKLGEYDGTPFSSSARKQLMICRSA